MPSPRTAARPSAAINTEALRPAIAAAGADGHVVGAILLPHALGAQHHDASPPASGLAAVGMIRQMGNFCLVPCPDTLCRFSRSFRTH